MNGKIMMNGKAYTSSGTPVKEVTLSEYLALPDWKRSNGVMYMIKDVANEGVGFPPLIYSTDEREVGVWYNGKPVYKLTVHNNTLAPEVNVETNIADLSSYNIDTVVSIDAIDHMIRSAGSVNRWMPNASYLETFYDPSSKYLKFRQSYAGQASNDLYITILYTKTTDVAGQGKWTTDGVYAHHYSTSEKVIGTWIDGKPLYEKCYSITLANGTIGTIDSTFIPKKFEAYMYYSGIDTGDCQSNSFVYEGSNLWTIWIDNRTITGKMNSVYVGKSAVLVLQYTKTID